MAPAARIAALVTVLVAALAFVGCGDSSADDPVKARVAAGTVNGLCPVLERPVVPGVFVEHEGQKVGFCCGPCRPKFLKDPEGYMKAMREDRSRYAYVGS